MFMKTLFQFINLICLLSCTTKKPTPSEDFKTLISDTSISRGREIDFSKRQSELLNLPYIFKGVDSFELRIWSSGFSTRSDLFVLRYNQDRWIVANYIYYDKDQIVDSLHLLTRKVSNDTATKIQQYLTQDSILNLPSQIAIPNFRDNTSDGDVYCIEFATKRLYKQLSYHNPEHFKEKSHKRSMTLLEFINSQFKIYYPY